MMGTILLAGLIGGLLLLGLALLVGRWIGVTEAGYSLAEELPIFLLISVVPAAFAGFVWWKLS